ncbi:MAG: cytochrome P450 [Burkholderiales bacterium]
MTHSHALADGFDLRQLSDAFYDDPYPTFHALREHAPVKRMPDGSVLLTRYADVIAVYKDPKTFSSDKHEEFGPKYGLDSKLFEHHTTSLVFNDPPLHTRVRRLIAGALTPRHVNAMEDGLVRLVDGLLDAMRVRAEHRETIDLIESFAAAIPVEIIGNLLGVPHDERGPLRDWSLAILGALEPALSPEQHARGNAAVRDMLGYLEGLVARRAAAPRDPETDVLTRLIQGEAIAADGGAERLLAKELLHNCIFLLNAGHETTTNLIGNGLKCLLDAPAQKRRLLAEPELIRTAIEEFLRIESSNQLGNRITTVETHIGDVLLAPRTQVTLCIAAANRDPAQFADPDVLDIARAPNRHVAFGSGIHQCVGMGLGRLEGRIAISRFLASFPNYRLNGPAVRSRRVRFRGHIALPCTLLG